MLSILAASLGVLLASFAIATADARQFRSSDVQPLDSPTVQAVALMGKLLQQRSSGRYGITVDHGDKDSENFTLAQLRTGTLDMARLNLAVFNSIVPATIVPALPYLFRSMEHLRRVLDGPVGDEILASMESAGVIGLCFYDMGVRSLYSTKAPIRKVGDLQGLSVRVQPSDIFTEMIKAMGAKPVAVPFDRMAPALKAGVIDAAESSWAAYVGAGHHRVTRYYSLTEHSRMPGVLVFSRAVWSELPAADRQAIRAAARESVTFMRGRLDGYEASARLKAESAAIEVIDAVDRKSFADVLTPLYPKLVPDAALQRMIKRVQDSADLARGP
ncbi:MAG: TRAP transporter substrate-binding protein [Enhydrobacter sp.]|nr:TRAP transporter substrate-binding protein [Enhydrobacter sp.]